MSSNETTSNFELEFVPFGPYFLRVPHKEQISGPITLNVGKLWSFGIIWGLVCRPGKGLN